MPQERTVWLSKEVAELAYGSQTLARCLGALLVEPGVTRVVGFCAEEASLPPDGAG